MSWSDTSSETSDHGSFSIKDERSPVCVKEGTTIVTYRKARHVQVLGRIVVADRSDAGQPILFRNLQGRFGCVGVGVDPEDLPRSTSECLTATNRIQLLGPF